MKTKTLKKRNSALSDSAKQLDILSVVSSGVEGFEERVNNLGFDGLRPTKLEILQINLGYMCNLTCEHCHVDAGPDRKEVMSKDTLIECLKVIDQTEVATVDLTGGAPEMNPNFMWFVEELTKRNVKAIVRSNLTILESNKKFKTYPEFFKEHKIEVIASLPCYTEGNTDKQRGEGVFSDSIKALKVLNSLGYGKSDTGLLLNLVFNPGGPSLPPDQLSLEADYKRELKENFDIDFNRLYTITNLPISRFLDYLLVLGRYEEYMDKLANAFNPSALEGLMCKNTLSVKWNGDLYDCDFNQMLDLKVDSPLSNIKDFNNEVLLKRKVVVKQHCYGCTAGAGSSCQGALV